MLSDKTLQYRKSILRARGVPEKFIQYLATRKTNGWGQLGTTGLLAAVLYGAVFAITSQEARLTVLVYGHLNPAILFSPLTFFVFFSMAVLIGVPLIALFGSIVIGMVFFPGRVRPWPASNAWATSLRTLNRNETLKSIKPRIRYQQLGHLTSEVAFLEALVRRSPAAMLKLFFKLSVIVLLLSAGLWALAAHDYWQVTAQTVEFHRPWGTRIYALRDVRRVETRCIDGGKDAGYQYWLVLPDLSLKLFPTINLASNIDKPGTMARLNQIDQRLRALNIPNRATGYRGETSVEFNACVTKWRKESRIVDPQFPHLVTAGR